MADTISTILSESADQTTKVQSVLEAYEEELSDTSSYIYELVNVFTEMDDTEDNFIIFYCVFRDVYNGVFTLEEIVDYIIDEGLEFNMESIDAFLYDKYNSNTIKYRKVLYKKVFFAEYQPNGILIQFLQSLYDGTFVEKGNISNGVGGYITSDTIAFHQSNSHTADLLAKNDKWMVFPTIEYTADSDSIKAFRNMRYAELQYDILFNEYAYSEISNISILESDMCTNLRSFLIYLKDWRWDPSSDSDTESFKAWFTIDRPEPFFLRKIIQKTNFSHDPNIDGDLEFAVKRSYNPGISQVEMFEMIYDFIVDLTEDLNCVAYRDYLDPDNAELPLEQIKTAIENKYDSLVAGDLTSKTIKEFIFYRWMYYFFHYESSSLDELKTMDSKISTYYTKSKLICDLVNGALNYIVEQDPRFTRGTYGD